MEKKYPIKDVVNFIGQTSLFSSCDSNDLFELATVAEQKLYDNGATILQSGKPVQDLGILLRGRASLMLIDATNGSKKKIEQLSPGGFYGEVGLLLGSSNPLAVVAEEECFSLIVGKQILEKIFQKYPTVSVALAKRIASRFIQLSVMGPRPTAAPSDESLSLRTSRVSIAAPSIFESADDKERITWVDVSSYNLSRDVIQMIPTQIIRKHRILPLELHGKKLIVGMVNPRSVAALEELQRVLHTVDPEIVAISSDDFSQAFVRLKLDTTETKSKKQTKAKEVELVYTQDQDKDADKNQLYLGNEVVKLLDKIFTEAIEMGASDIHIEPEVAGVKIRYRVQGGLQDRKEFLSSSYAAPLIARIKVLSDLDITERRRPQDGRIFAQMGKMEINLRVSTIPVARGEKAVIRVIDTADAMRPLHQVAINPTVEKALRNVLGEPYGAIVVAGPTGSGKSSTLYALLNERRLTRPDNAIVTVEDPIEYLLHGVTQVPVVQRVNFGFAQALRGIVRQDPDVIMIGELRDRDTTTIMIEAALTGHLVLTSIHGNNATAVIQRLQHLGTDAILLSQALSIIVVQRLVKRLCPHCVTESEVSPALYENLVSRKIVAPGGSTILPRPVGCEACDNSGYLGRVAVQEVMNFDDGVRGALASGAKPEELIEKSKERRRYFSFAQAAAYMMGRRILSPGEALLVVAD